MPTDKLCPSFCSILYYSVWANIHMITYMSSIRELFDLPWNEMIHFRTVTVKGVILSWEINIEFSEFKRLNQY
jgi:hypothetical protein